MRLFYELIELVLTGLYLKGRDDKDLPLDRSWFLYFWASVVVLVSGLILWFVFSLGN